MKSSQVRLFLTSEDEADLLARLGKIRTFVAIKHASNSPSPRVLKLPLAPGGGFSPRQVLLAMSLDGPHFDWVASEDGQLHIVDKIESEVIEFTRSGIDGQPRGVVHIGPGRIWFSLVDHVGKPKSNRFCNWAKAVAADARAFSASCGDGYRIGPDAAQQLRRHRASLAWR
jgi:hypothetical protein